MKKIIIIALALVFVSCKNNSHKNSIVNITKSYISFGKKIDLENVISAEEMGEKFKKLKEGDTINVKFVSQIESVCKRKGCWINVPVGKGNKSFVKFKDYAFFMPMNSEGSDVILNGKAYIHIIPVNQLKHYAEDAGKTEEEIKKITQPKRILAFLADGVLLTQPDEKN